MNDKWKKLVPQQGWKDVTPQMTEGCVQTPKAP